MHSGVIETSSACAPKVCQIVGVTLRNVRQDGGRGRGKRDVRLMDLPSTRENCGFCTERAHALTANPTDSGIPHVRFDHPSSHHTPSASTASSSFFPRSRPVPIFCSHTARTRSCRINLLSSDYPQLGSILPPCIAAHDRPNSRPNSRSSPKSPRTALLALPVEPVEATPLSTPPLQSSVAALTEVHPPLHQEATDAVRPTLNHLDLPPPPPPLAHQIRSTTTTALPTMQGKARTRRPSRCTSSWIKFQRDR